MGKSVGKPPYQSHFHAVKSNLEPFRAENSIIVIVLYVKVHKCISWDLCVDDILLWYHVAFKWFVLYFLLSFKKTGEEKGWSVRRHRILQNGWLFWSPDDLSVSRLQKCRWSLQSRCETVWPNWLPWLQRTYQWRRWSPAEWKALFQGIVSHLYLSTCYRNGLGSL